jgi:predicted MFS family arabinose efflux permease
MTVQDIGAIRPGLLFDGLQPNPARRSKGPSKRVTSTDRSFTELQLVLFVLGPFAAAYFLSYVFRTINALLAGTLSRDLDIGPSELGLLTSVYFLSIAAVQLPLGTMLDRYGPRRVQGCFMFLAAVGAAMFAIAEGMTALVIGRALIGIGVATALMAGLKAAVLWFPPERIVFANGLIVMTGALGAVAATLPAEHVISAIGWRGLFATLAILCVVSSILILAAVPERTGHTKRNGSLAPVTFRSIYADPRFLRLAPLSTMVVGTAWSLQGLWIAPWLADVEQLGREAVVGYLLLMGLALAGGALTLGCSVEWARRHGATREALLAALAAAFMLAQTALILRTPVPIAVSLLVIAAAGAATVLSYAILPAHFAKDMSGRVNAALNVLHMFGAFLLQWLTGAVIDLWAPIDGRPPVVAYQAALGIGLGFQVLALGWFLLPRLMSKPAIVYKAGARAFAPTPGLETDRRNAAYDRALMVWSMRVADARSERMFWRAT